MSYDELLSGKISLISVFKLSWEIFNKALSSILILMAVLVVPVNLLYRLGIKYLTEYMDLHPNLAASASIGWAIIMNPFLLLVNLAVFDLLYSAIKKDELKIASSVINALKKWVQSILTTILACMIVFVPLVVTALGAAVLMPSFQAGTSSNSVTIIIFTVIISIIGIAAIAIMIYYGVSFIFFPLAVLFRDKWLAGSLKYSRSVVKSRWWFCLLLVIIFTIFPAGSAFLIARMSDNSFFAFLSVLATSFITTFLSLPYIIYFLNFEKLNGLPAE